MYLPPGCYFSTQKQSSKSLFPSPLPSHPAGACLAARRSRGLGSTPVLRLRAQEILALFSGCWPLQNLCWTGASLCAWQGRPKNPTPDMPLKIMCLNIASNAMSTLFTFVFCRYFKTAQIIHVCI